MGFVLVNCLCFIFARDLGSVSIIRVSKVFVKEELNVITGPIGKFYKMQFFLVHNFITQSVPWYASENFSATSTCPMTEQELKFLLSRAYYICTWAIVSLCSRMAERRGRQNSCVRQTWQGYYFWILSWPSLNIMFSGLITNIPV